MFINCYSTGMTDLQGCLGWCKVRLAAGKFGRWPQEQPCSGGRKMYSSIITRLMVKLTRSAGASPLVGEQETLAHTRF